jgi:hypothetical protein
MGLATKTPRQKDHKAIEQFLLGEFCGLCEFLLRPLREMDFSGATFVFVSLI